MKEGKRIEIFQEKKKRGNTSKEEKKHSLMRKKSEIWKKKMSGNEIQTNLFRKQEKE